jgi:hypothetical protein
VWQCIDTSTVFAFPNMYIAYKLCNIIPVVSFLQSGLFKAAVRGWGRVVPCGGAGLYSVDTI